ncbi:MAG: hypothetical protein QOC71_444 [Thermoplasmata archaeon]|jgi:hypothetical protein|nr:hypothetical protein [Thermoplasmata archaeon]
MRPLLLAALTLLAAAAPASANVMNARTVMAPPAVAAPLEGEGENMKLIGNVEVPGLTELDMAGDHAFLASDAGLTIVNVSDPKAPFIESIAECAAGYGDVDVNAQATVAVLGTDSGNPDCDDTQDSGTVVFDVTDKKHPVFKSMVPVAVGSHTQTLDYPYLYINNYDPEYRIIEIYDISDLEKPKKVSQVEMNGTAAHDSYVDHRPDGKTLLYSASVATHDVVDVTNPAAPMFLQKVRDSQVTISHQVEPNFKRDVLIATDEYGGGAASGVCGKSPTADATYLLGGEATAAQGNGFVHFYGAAEDGTFANNGLLKKGTFNIPLHAPETSGCTAHVFWQAPSENRLTIAWYAQGVRIVDFNDPAQAKELGWFVPTGSSAWGAKPHKGHVFVSDMSRGLDVYEYTGEGGKGWPATSEPAEVTRLRRIGLTPSSGTAPVAPPAKPQPAASRTLGAFSLKTKLKRVPGKKGKKAKLTFTVTDASNVVVSKLRFSKKSGRKVAVRASGVAIAGRYRYVIRVGDRGKVLKRGLVTVKEKPGLALAPNASLVCRVR